jgi:hypothetical protein
VRAILVNPFRGRINEIETTGELVDLYSLIGCRYIEGAYPFGRRVAGHGETVFVDEEGALKNPPPPRWFVIGYRWPLYGRGVVLGYRGDGDNVSTRLTIAQVSSVVIFN